VRNTGLPVRSAILKPHAGVLVVGSVTTSESALLYVFDFWPFRSQGVGRSSTTGIQKFAEGLEFLLVDWRGGSGEELLGRALLL
jgi:hypothetical protein